MRHISPGPYAAVLAKPPTHFLRKRTTGQITESFHSHFFLVFHDDEEEKGLPGWLVGRRDFPALPPGHLNISAQVLSFHLEATQSTVR